MEMSSVRLLIFAMIFIARLPVYGKVLCSFNICSLYDPCMNGGTCKPDSNCEATCSCLPGFNGKFCQKPDSNVREKCRNECTQETCHKFGNCSFDKETCNTKCKCELGYGGKYCNHQECGFLICVHGSCNKLNNETFQCKCDDGWIGETCNLGCSRICSYGQCIISNGEEICSCNDRYTPDSNCTEKEIPSAIVEEWDKRYLGFIAIPIVLSIILAVLLYVMWRYRFTFILKIIYTFQNYEDHDGKEYDAFISFRSTSLDEYWVFNTLFPTLENEMGFKVCVHFRDFVVGETISNNIISAIEKSRRTILVLSPDYVISEWTRMEYQVAHQEMLKKRQRIIPIIYRDINKLELDKNLSYILKSITYLEWPENTGPDDRKHGKFWQKLLLTMPKKREAYIENGNEAQIDISSTNV